MPRAGWSDTFRLGHRQIFGYPGFDRRGRAIRGMPAHPDANLFSVDARPVRARADGLRPLWLGITKGPFRETILHVRVRAESPWPFTAPRSGRAPNCAACASGKRHCFTFEGDSQGGFAGFARAGGSWGTI